MPKGDSMKVIDQYEAAATLNYYYYPCAVWYGE